MNTYLSDLPDELSRLVYKFIYPLYEIQNIGLKRANTMPRSNENKHFFFKTIMFKKQNYLEKKHNNLIILILKKTQNYKANKKRFHFCEE